MIRFRLLGTIDLRNADGQVLLPVLAQPKRLAVLAYLAAGSPAGLHRRDTLVALFWPELDQEHARNALSKAIHFLRRALGEGAIISRGSDEVSLGHAAISTDVTEFAAALEGHRFEAALELYRGDLLQSFYVPAAPGFEEWLERERARLRARAAAAARLLSEAYEKGQHYTRAVDSARRALELSGGDERAMRRLIELLDRAGDRAGAIRAYEDFARKLAAELEAEPSPETTALIARVRLSPSPRSAGESTAPERSESTLARLAGSLDGRYKIERELGAGAMAVVALAHDLRHHRRVAIKVLRPELSSLMGPERFLREIDIVASLMHPHILPLHDSGEAGGLLYYVMPYVDGESLRGRLEREGPLPLREAIQIGREVADALAYAHHRGFIHRDIKPENILLGGGHALVADFGIARAIGSAGGEQLMTKGFATGTPAYMSPEQLTGDSPVDERSDIYALGCVVYEMLAGEPPFGRNTGEAGIDRRLNDPPPRVSHSMREIPPELDEVISRAIATKSIDRFQSAASFAAALLELALSRTESRNPVIHRWMPTAAAAVLLLAGAWAVGDRVQHSGGMGPAAVSTRVASATSTGYGAYDLYLQAKHFVGLQTVEDVQKGVQLFDNALALDSTFVEAWLGLAAAYDWLSQFGGKSSADMQAAWQRAIDRAIALDSLNATAYVQRGSLRNRFQWDFAGASDDLRRAIALSPGSADAYLNYAQFLNVIGLHDSALVVMRHAVDINPTVPFRVANLVPRLRMAGFLNQAAAEARRALALDSTLWIAHLMLAAVLDDQAKPMAAAAEAEQAQRIAGDLPFVLATVARYYGRAGRRSDAMAALVKLTELARRQYVQRVFAAEALVGVGDRAGALDALEESARVRESDLTWKLAYGHFKELRGEPRYSALMSRIGLPDARTPPPVR